MVVFDQRSTLGLVKLRTKKASYEVSAVFEEVARDSDARHGEDNSFFSEITDEDIDSLFN